MTDITERLAEIEARVEAATEGPWRFEPEGESHCGEPQCCSEYWDNRIWGADRVLAESHMLSEADAEFIAHARTDVPWLVEQVRQRDEVLHWLISMDEPESEARRTVTLTEIIRRARVALEGDGR